MVGMKGASQSRSTADRPDSKYREYRGSMVAITNAPQTVTYAVDLVSANTVDLALHEIVINHECLKDGYIDDRLRARGLDAQQIRKARSKVRSYLSLLIDDKGVDMTDDAYDMLVNMAIHLIEESSKAE